MKKIVLLLTVLMATLTAHADDYTFLTFETTDGAKAYVPVESMTMAINETTLTAGSQTFALANLAQMYFSATDESTTTAIELTKAMLDEASEIYDMQGKKVTKAQMTRGAYIIKTTDGNYKMMVK